MQRKIFVFGTKRDNTTRDWRKYHNEKLHSFYSTLHAISVIKSRRMKWLGEGQLWERKVDTGFLWINFKERDHLDYLGLMGDDKKIWIGFIRLKVGKSRRLF
jgi:hypothetical protein